MKARLLRKVRRKVGSNYRILTRRHKQKIYQIWEYHGDGRGWCTVDENRFWWDYRHDVFMEARRILGDRIFNIKYLG